MSQVRVKVLTNNDLEILGEMRTSLFDDGYSCQISDLLNNSRTFIELTDVEVYSQGQLLTHMASLCINKPAIAFLGEG
ncbi:hypothetical protein H6F96_11825 [Microcoleus sp. FACHB-53]|jgi:hypothetical protein|nr:hypothetical protein [Microcoleus sp. FACHB-53]